MMEWQDIATAPKDGTGTRVLLWMQFEPYYPGADGPKPCCDIGYWTTFNGGGWVTTLIGTPSHWCKLPDPPKEREG